MKLLHAYDDLMNLYGDYANLSVLTRHLQEQGFSVVLDRRTVGEPMPLEEYDLVFIGSGMESNQKVVLADLLLHKASMEKAVNHGTIFLLTGNAFELLGKTVTDAAGKEYEGLGLMDFTVQETEQRMTGDVIFRCTAFPEPLVGFVNKCTEIKGIMNPLFSVEMGLGNQKEEKSEGIQFQNVFGTHLTGPALVKNPAFLNYFVTLLGRRENPAFQPIPLNDSYGQAAYEITLKELQNRLADKKG